MSEKDVGNRVQEEFVDGGSGSGGGLSWAKGNEILAVSLAYLLIFLYVSPVFLISFSYFQTDGFQEVDFAYKWFVAFMETSDSTLNELHKVLFPIISALSIIVFRGKVRLSMVLLALLVLLLFVCTTFISVIFDMAEVKLAVGGLDVQMNLQLVKQFFSRVQETMMMYFMMLIGIGVANSRDKGAGGLV